MTSENCPQCDKKLPPTFKSSGRQVCSGCGWSNKPKTVTTLPSPTNEAIKPLPSPEAPKEKVSPSKLNVTINQQSIELDPIHLSGIIGSTILFLGTFTPLVKLPIVGSLGLTNSSIKAFIIACAVGSLILTLKKMYKWLTLTGLGAALTVTYIFLDFLMRIEDAKSSMDGELASNPFRGLADVAIESIHLEWGWLFLFVGAGLIINTPRLAKIINLKQAIGGFIATGFVGMVLFASIANLMAEDSMQQVRQLEGKNNIGAIIFAEQMYHFDNDEFTGDLRDLDLSFISSNFEYYSIDITDANEEKAIVVAKSLDKKQKLKSYAEAISYSSAYKFERISCETKKPSITINTPTFSSSGWSCGSDSIPSE